MHIGLLKETGLETRVALVPRSLKKLQAAGVDNDVFYTDKTMMLFGDAKTMMGQLNKALAEG